MEKDEDSFKKYLKSIQEDIRKLRNNPTEPKIYPLRIEKIEKKFKTFSEKKTPKQALSGIYTCIGRVKFYGDGNMFIYLEIADNDKKQLAWPVRATWKVELTDDNDDGKNNNTLILGEATCIFNKPKQGFVSHPNDWILVGLDTIKSSEFIARDNSVTIRWSVFTEPVLQEVYLDKFTEILNNAENYYDLFHGGAIHKLKEDMSNFNKNSEEHHGRISKLETLLPSINDKLDKIEQRQNLIEGNLKCLMSRKDNSNEHNIVSIV